MKHSYRIDCTCDRCTKERARRNAQADSAPRRTTRQRTTGLDRWARIYYDTEGACDRNDPGDR